MNDELSLYRQMKEELQFEISSSTDSVPPVFGKILNIVFPSFVLTCNFLIITIRNTHADLNGND